MKKIAVFIYPYFSIQEISCLSSALVLNYNQKIEVFASNTTQAIVSEEGFTFYADKSFDMFIANDYSCVILPGIYNPLPALFDDNLISSLRTLQGKDILIAAISSAPLLLAKANLLAETLFTAGIWDEIITYFSFIPDHNFCRKPVVVDKKIVTAIGFAFREFAIEVIKCLELDTCENGLFNGITKEYSEKELTYQMGKDNFKEFLAEYNRYL